MIKNYQNILFVIQGHNISDIAFQNTIEAANKTGAKITFLALLPEFSGDFADFQDTYKEHIKDVLNAKLEKAGIDTAPDLVFENKTPHFVSIIKFALKNDHDLVVKAVESDDKKESKGLKSLDMSLLRKCPCPVWLCRDIKRQAQPKILTAIDPESDAPEGHHLSVKLLQIGEFLADTLEGTHEVISCWEFEHEGFLRDSPFGKVEGAKVDKMIAATEKKHKQDVDALIKEAGVKTPGIIHERGKPQNIIPSHADRDDVELVVMGTVARTGIPGFIIGNTAENILQNLSCSLYAVKPSGFVSPIKAY